MAAPIYTPKPLPVYNGADNAFNGMYGVVDNVFNRIVTVLQSVPVIPNPNGLYDPSTGLWLAPAVSFFDVLVAALVIGTFVSVVIRISGGGSGIAGNLTRNLSNEIKK